MSERRLDGRLPCRATVRTPMADPGAVAAAVSPDNTPQMHTRVECGASGERPAGDTRRCDVVVTDIERDATGGLRATLDDYVVNLSVAQQVVQLSNAHEPNHE